jgi:hypothetical protein
MAAAVAALLHIVQPTRADSVLDGIWTIVKAEPAPWSDTKSYPPNRDAVPTYVGKRVVFGPGQIEGPDLLACANPNYQVKDFPAAGLFQGQLGELQDRGGRKAEEAATAIGFATRPIRTVVTDCMHSIDFHMSDADHAAFALDNMIYWLRRGGAP